MKTINFNKLNVIKSLILSAFLVLLFMQFSGCSDSGTTNPISTSQNGQNASISIKTDNGVFDNPADEIVITEAKALVTQVEFELEGSETEHEVNAGPFVINFNMSGGLTPVTIGNIPAGVYDKIKFQIHKPEDNESIPDPEFREGSSGSQRYSFIIKGTYNGNVFVFKSRKTVNLVINFNTPVNFQSAGKNITILINPSIWFKNGNLVLDPRNISNEDDIDNNLKNSFKRAFEDDDKNGLPDDH